MLQKMMTFVLVMMAAQTLSAQEVLTAQQDNWNTTLDIQKDVNTRSLGKFTFDLRCYDPFNIQKTANIFYG